MFTIGAIFWIIYIIGVVLGFYSGYKDRTTIPVSLWLLVLLFLLGVGTFGSPIK
jgi:RsiW-degrading membrane proteinase PrsW (M82 family)